MLALVPPVKTSAHNILRGILTGIRREEGPHAKVQMVIGPTKSTAHITRHSVDRTDLEPGRPINAMRKFVSIDRRSLGYTMEPSDI